MRPATPLAAVLLMATALAAPLPCRATVGGRGTQGRETTSPEPAAGVPPPIETNRSPPPEALYRPPVDVEADPDAFYAPTHYRERGLSRTAGGWDADARGWIASFRTYVREQALRPTHQRHTIYLCPLGRMTYGMRRRTRIVREFLEVYLALPVRMLPAARIAGRPIRVVTVRGQTVRQYEAGDLKDHVLIPRLPADGLALMGITAEDLYSTEVDWDCVGNLTCTGRGFAVCSLARLFPEFYEGRGSPVSERLGLALALRMVADAGVGMLGPTPCRKYYCAMNQAKHTTMDEPVHLCPGCLRKLRWGLGFDVIKRYQALRRFYCRYSMMDEARWVLKRLKECVPAAEAARAASSTTAQEAAAEPGEPPSP